VKQLSSFTESKQQRMSLKSAASWPERRNKAAYPEGGATGQVFTPRCVAAFKRILAAVPSAKVVFSTTWRLDRHVDRLHEQWLEHGFPASLAIDGTPDLRQDSSILRRHQRGLEIRAWLEAHPTVTRWVVIDVEKMSIEEILNNDRCVFTAPTLGLTEKDAFRAIRIWSGPSLCHGWFPCRG
jgi:hypothetical protein